ncbi:MAG: PAS domain S-box protein [Chloroflexi bacterium]|nr:PAS domain S-box protein [Chloroflexota bacterium]
MAHTDDDPKFEALLDYLQRSRGFDFTGYKRTSLTRRVGKRMEMVGVHDYGEYTDYLEVHPEEFSQLFNTILINVTNFFRDQPAWDFLAKEIVPKLIASNRSLRVWCAGVASGEEAYTTAMIFAEAMGTDNFLERVKVYATDVDDEALTQARQASYRREDLEQLPEELRKRYFEMLNSRGIFRADLRRSVIFGRHDLVQDAPISRLDLLISRNTLMYFNIETQTRILARFHFALKEEGYLFLGKAEMLLTHANLFAPVDLRHRIFSKISRNDLRERAFMGAPTEDAEAHNRTQRYLRMRDAALETHPTAQIVVDLNNTLVMANNRARSLFGFSAKDLGRSFAELELSYRPVELRSRIEQAYAERHPVVIPEVARNLSNDGRQYLDVEVIPLQDNDGTWIGVTITFDDVTRRHQLQQDLQRTRQDLETAYEELQSANEELETTNEELQSTVEELQTTNEELQSTNEELETMNEELQSTNEEQETTNMELRQRTGELGDSNAFQSSILHSLRAGVVVVDHNLSVLVWNRAAEDLWGLRADEVLGHSFFKLDIGLPVDKLGNVIRSCMSGACDTESLMLAARNRRGKMIQCSVKLGPLTGPRQERRGVVLMMEED